LGAGFFSVMEEEITVFKISQYSSKYLAFVLHPAKSGFCIKPFPKIVYIILFATLNPFVLLYVKFATNIEVPFE
jgi:hypothetical protein